MSYDVDSKDLREAIERDEVVELAVGTYTVHQTNWSGNAQQYMKPHIVTALDTESVLDACASIRTAHLSKYGGTVSVIITKCWNPWAVNTKYYYDATYRNDNGLFYIAIFSSD